MSQIYSVVDYETRSEANLKQVGAWEYACHPSTEILCVAWRTGNRNTLCRRPTQVWSPYIEGSCDSLLEAFADTAVRMVAHGAFFERCITRFVFAELMRKAWLRKLAIERWECTMASALNHALPRSLEVLSAALNLRVQKDIEGQALMKKMCKPRKPTKDNPAKWHNSITDLKRLMQYCVTDVDTQTEVFLALPELTPVERKIWVMDQRINDRGFRVDRATVNHVLGMIEEESVHLNKRTAEITEGKVTSTTQVAKTGQWLSDHGCSLPDLTASVVETAIKSGLAQGACKDLLKIRRSASKSSTAKYKKFLMTSEADGRVHGSLVYCGAATRRFTAQNVQPHNFPRPTIKGEVAVADSLRTLDLEDLRLFYGDPMQVLSSCLRPMIIASEGKRLFCGDWNAIELCVLFWLAGHERGLADIRSRIDLYVQLAMRIYDLSIGEIDSEKRYTGKKGTLSCGYQIGGKAFQEACRKEGLIISLATAIRTVKAYRSTHRPVVTFWADVERAAIRAIQRPGEPQHVRYLDYVVHGDFLYCFLPSGEKIAYYKPSIKWVTNQWGKRQPKIYYWGTNSKTKKWQHKSIYGGKLVAMATQGTARDVMCAGMLRLEKAGYEIELTVHDEGLGEKAGGSLKEFEEIISISPAWAKGCPIRVECWEGLRYRK